MNSRIKNFGFSERFMREANQYPDLILGRVIAQYKGVYKVATDKTEVLSEVSGKMRYSSDAMSDYPAVGDFVLIDRDEINGNAIIHHVLSRKSMFVRRSAGTGHDVQTVATNIDTVLICMSLNNDFNLRRLERYLSITWDSGAIPVVVLTKSDLCADIPTKRSEIEKIALGVDIVITSSRTEDGYQSLLKYLAPGQTVAFMGSSGVGKSTLINRLLGEDVMETRELRSDDKGRHATTRRELMILPTGGAVIDTPGMREIGLESVNLMRTFPDIEELAEQCRFKNCHHENEPDCAVKKAIDAGLMEEDRWISYKKLKREARYESLNSKQIEKDKMNDMFSSFGGAKNAKKFIKAKSKNR